MIFSIRLCYFTFDPKKAWGCASYIWLALVLVIVVFYASLCDEASKLLRSCERVILGFY